MKYTEKQVFMCSKIQDSIFVLWIYVLKYKKNIKSHEI